jgi:hypothetical protein
MSTCQFYKIKTETIPSCETNIKIPYCTHKEVRNLSIEYLSKILGSTYVLKCNGNIDKCQLPKLI